MGVGRPLRARCGGGEWGAFWLWTENSHLSY